MLQFFADIDPIQYIAGTATAIAAIVGAYAAFIAKRTESRTATREEVEQALQAQDDLLAQYRTRITELRTDYNEMKSNHQECEDRLKSAEQKIARFINGDPS